METHKIIVLSMKDEEGGFYLRAVNDGARTVVKKDTAVLCID